MKYCRDCKHYQRGEFTTIDSCYHPSFAQPPDLVRGATPLLFCVALRSAGGNCGPDASGFEDKETEEL